MPWKVIFAFVGVFVAGAVFGGVFTLGVSARRNLPRPASPMDRTAQYAPVVQPKSPVPGAPGAKAGPPALVRSNPITPILMTQFTRKLKGLTPAQRDSLRTILGRAGEDFHRLRQENLSDVARVTGRMYSDVSAVLTPEQRTELEQMRERVEQRLQEDRRKRAEAAAAEAASRASAGVLATPAGKTRSGKTDAKRGIPK